MSETGHILSFMGVSAPEAVRPRIYDGTGPSGPDPFALLPGETLAAAWVRRGWTPTPLEQAQIADHDARMAMLETMLRRPTAAGGGR